MDKTNLHRAGAWEHLIFGRYPIGEVLAAVADAEWQRVRVSMLGASLGSKMETLERYLGDEPTRKQKVRVTNYVYALKRGGLIK